MPQGACRTPGLAETRHPGGRLKHLILILYVFSLVTFSEPRRGQEEQEDRPWHWLGSSSTPGALLGSYNETNRAGRR